MLTNYLYSCALHWIAKYLTDFILLGIHSVYMLYIYMYVCVHIHTHTHIHIHIHHIHRFKFLMTKGKKRACFSTNGGKEKWVCE